MVLLYTVSCWVWTISMFQCQKLKNPKFLQKSLLYHRPNAGHPFLLNKRQDSYRYANTEYNLHNPQQGGFDKGGFTKQLWYVYHSCGTWLDFTCHVCSASVRTRCHHCPYLFRSTCPLGWCSLGVKTWGLHCKLPYDNRFDPERGRRWDWTIAWHRKGPTRHVTPCHVLWSPAWRSCPPRIRFLHNRGVTSTNTYLSGVMWLEAPLSKMNTSSLLLCKVARNSCTHFHVGACRDPLGPGCLCLFGMNPNKIDRLGRHALSYNIVQTLTNKRSPRYVLQTSRGSRL
jgi:hypothetical protein